MNDLDKSSRSYDLRQYQRILGKLQDYSKGKSSLPTLIEGLESLLSALEQPDPEWHDAFRANWWTLEQVYAVALDRENLDQLPLESQAFIDDAITRLTQLACEAVFETRRLSTKD